MKNKINERNIYGSNYCYSCCDSIFYYRIKEQIKKVSISDVLTNT